MSDKQQPLVSAAELDALILEWGYNPNQSIDRFFPVRFWYLAALAFLNSMWLLFFTDDIAKLMTSDPTELVRMGRFLYFRGWFLMGVWAMGVYSYLRNWYTGIVFSSMFMVGCVNFVFDLFNIYAEALANPTPRITLMLIVRIVGLWFVYITVKNSSRMPDVKDRMNILLPFKKDIRHGT